MFAAGASAAAPAAAVLAVAGDHVPGLLDRVEARLAELATGHGSLLARHAGETIAAGGKRLRPLLVLLAAGPPAGDAPRVPAADGAGDIAHADAAARSSAAATGVDGLVRAAVAVELIHAATLVHDDVLDDSALRRGRPTVVAAAGRAIATATGDLLFSRAFAEIARNGVAAEVQVLSQASSALAAGELLQRADAWNAAVPIERYERRCELKTARLFEAACALGARYGTAPADVLVRFGRRIGLAFQLLDDVLDVSGPPERTGKPRGADLLDGTVTLPFILAREHDPSLAALDPRTIDIPPRAAEVCDRIAATGALAEAKQRALEIVAAAKAELAQLDAAHRRPLELVADGVVERYA